MLILRFLRDNCLFQPTELSTSCNENNYRIYALFNFSVTTYVTQSQNYDFWILELLSLDNPTHSKSVWRHEKLSQKICFSEVRTEDWDWN
jgi:hypothetical protein